MRRTLEAVYKIMAARPATAARPAKAVWRAAPADDEDVEEEVAVPLEALPEAEVEALETTDEIDDSTLESTEEPLDSTELRPAEAEAPAPTAVKTVVKPTVVEKVELPEVTTETIGDVVTAEEEPVSVAPAPPAP
jgi:hypothetical protein